jgi:glycosyltransferase involved in cell wall biosynthesis
MERKDQRITVLHLCEHFGGKESSLHGPARAFQWWIPSFDARRFRVLLCSRKGYDKAAQQMIEAGVPPLYLGYGKTDPRNLIALIRLVRREKVDIIHAHGYGACTWGRLAGLLLCIPVIVHERCNYSTVPFPQRMVEWLLAPLTKYAFAVSESTRQFTIEKRYIKAGAVMTLYNGILLDRLPKVDPDWVKKTRASLGAAGNEMVIGMVGRLEAQKGHTDALLAFQKVARDFPAARLWIVGDGTREAEIRTQIEALGLSHVVTMLGYRSDAKQLMQCFDIMLFASHHEGTPNTLYEALAMGRTCVASTADGLGEILEEGKTALLFAPGDVEAMARQLERVLADAPQRQALADQALIRAKDFDGMRCVHTMETTYEKIMSGK